jgi:hypothetical protein
MKLNNYQAIEEKINKLYINTLIGKYIKEYHFLFVDNMYTLDSIIQTIRDNKLKTEDHLGSYYFNNTNIADIKKYSAYALFFNVKQKYLYPLLHLLISIILPHQIVGRFKYNDTSDVNYLPKIVLYFVYPEKSKQYVLNIITNYIMLILSNISEEIIEEISIDCVLNRSKLQCCERGSFPINKLMFLKMTYGVSGDYDNLKIPYYEKKYYKYKYKYKALRIKEFN